MAEAAVELRAILDSAEKAASVQDFASAEHYLLRAATIQEAEFGPGHPELANTLNNLGIVFERLGKPRDAEASYRRAYAIASATLAPDDPLVMTSEQNLRDFCSATGKPFEIASPPVVAPDASSAAVTAVPAPVTAVPPPSPATTPAPAVAPRSLPPIAPPVSKPAAATPPQAGPKAPTQPLTAASARPVPKAPPRPVAKAASIPAKSDPSKSAAGALRVAQPAVTATPPATPAVGRSAVRAEPTLTSRGTLVWIVLVIAIASLGIISWFTSSSRQTDEGNENTATPSAASVAPPAAQPGAAAPPAAAMPESTRQPSTVAIEQPGSTQSLAADDVRATATSVSGRRSAASTGVSLVEARLCQLLSLSDWQCTPVTDPPPPGGRLFFYTRVKAASDTTVQHRWYVNGGLLQTVNLRIRANSGAGFRTYSRNTVPPERRGTWRIELRDAEGALLHEERFVVQ